MGRVGPQLICIMMLLNRSCCHCNYSCYSGYRQWLQAVATFDNSRRPQNNAWIIMATIFFPALMMQTFGQLIVLVAYFQVSGARLRT